MTAQQECPLLHPQYLRGMDLSQMHRIEDHISMETCCPHPMLKDLVLTGKLEGSTPLLLACYGGYLNAVKLAVEMWGADVNSPAVFYVYPGADNKSISGASPLHAAALRGHLEITKYLVGKGANISAKTSCGLTPLHAACDGYYRDDGYQQKAIVSFLLESGADPNAFTSEGEPVWHMWYCSAEATMTLVEHGMSLTQHFPCSNGTIFQYWISDRLYQRRALDLVRFLVERGAVLNALGFGGYTSILASANQLELFDDDDTGPDFSILDFLLERKEIPNRDKIDALELAGAVLLYSTSLIATRRTMAFAYWRRALQLRQTKGNLLPKRPMVFKSAQNRSEWTTLAELEAVENRPSQHMIQALLVLIRIYSAIDESYILELEPATSQGFSETVDSLLILMEIFLLGFDLRDVYVWSNVSTNLEKLVGLLDRNHQLLSAEILESSSKLIVDADSPVDVDRTDEQRLKHLKILLQFVTILAQHPEIVNAKIMGLLSTLVRHDSRALHGKNLLLLACKSASSLAVIRLLLDAGADPLAVDLSGNGPLHQLVLSKIRDAAVMDPIALLLLDRGSHLII